VSSRISEGSTIYYPIVEFEAGGRQYRVTKSSGSSSGVSIGDEREVAYNPTSPANAIVITKGGERLFPLIFMFIGGSMAIIAPILYIRAARRSNAIQRLMQSGIKSTGVIVEIQSVNKGDSGAYRVVVAAPNQEGTTTNYVSDSLTGVGGIAMMDFRIHPIPVDVYISPVDPTNYYVDVADLPNLSPERISELIKGAINERNISVTNPGANNGQENVIIQK
jgi:hypothetical protein